MSLEPGLFVPTHADALIRGQRKIEAIKAVLDANPGASLRAAKDAVEARAEALLAGSASASASAPSPADGEAQDRAGLPAAVVEALLRGQTIEAIKLLRLAHDVDLRTAKQRVEAHLRGDAGADAVVSASPPDAAASAPGHLPADVVSLLHAGDRGAAWQLLERKYGVGSAEALRRIADYEIARKRRGLGGGAGSTVVRGGDGGKRLAWALLAAVVALAVAWALW